jgi:hypothetical protein
MSVPARARVLAQLFSAISVKLHQIVLTILGTVSISDPAMIWYKEEIIQTQPMFFLSETNM